MWPLEVFPKVSVPTATATPLSKLDRCSAASRGGRGAGTTDRGPGPGAQLCCMRFGLSRYIQFVDFTN